MTENAYFRLACPRLRLRLRHRLPTVTLTLNGLCFPMKSLSGSLSLSLPPFLSSCQLSLMGKRLLWGTLWNRTTLKRAQMPSPKAEFANRRLPRATTKGLQMSPSLPFASAASSSALHRATLPSRLSRRGGTTLEPARTCEAQGKSQGESERGRDRGRCACSVRKRRVRRFSCMRGHRLNTESAPRSRAANSGLRFYPTKDLNASNSREC